MWTCRERKMHRFELERAYILHTRPYRETSLLLELFTYQHGRLSVIAKGVKRSKVRVRGLLQPFVPLLVSCSGRGDLLTLRDFDSGGNINFLKGRSLISAFYLNELLIRLLHRWDPYQTLFLNYEQTLVQLGNVENEQKILRLFEKSLLKTLGYELQLLKEAQTGHGICADDFYTYDPQRGPILVESTQGHTEFEQKKYLFKGKSLLALAEEKLDDLQVLSDLKRLMRQVLSVYLDHKPLETRKLL